MNKMIPSIGRKVWFWPLPELCTVSMPPSQPEQFVRFDPAQALDATVVYVHSSTMVNLCVRDHIGRTHEVQSVYLRPSYFGEDMPLPAAAHATWMPYQIGQAAKTERMERMAEDAFHATHSQARP